VRFQPSTSNPEKKEKEKKYDLNSRINSSFQGENHLPRFHCEFELNSLPDTIFHGLQESRDVPSEIFDQSLNLSEDPESKILDAKSNLEKTLLEKTPKRYKLLEMALSFLKAQITQEAIVINSFHFLSVNGTGDEFFLTLLAANFWGNSIQDVGLQKVLKILTEQALGIGREFEALLPAIGTEQEQKWNSQPASKKRKR